MNDRFKISHANDGSVVYDLVNNCIIDEISDYSLYVIDILQLSPLTERLRTTHLVEFWRFLNREGYELNGVSDDVLRRFRDAAVVSVGQRTSSVGSERIARQTVNSKLFSIYHWLIWLSEERRIRSNVIGFRSSQVLLLPGMASSRSRFGRTSRYSLPLLFRNTGKGSKHRAGLSPSREKLDDVVEVIMRGRDEHAALRDSLALDIAIETGMRRGSINSLRRSSFSRDRIESIQSSTFSICPPSQKFGYKEDVQFPVWLAFRVCEFIEGQLRELLIKKRHLRGADHDSIFVSSRNGLPLTNRALSQSIAASMRAAGLPKGVSLHSGRRLFAIERIDSEIDKRIALGIDTSTESVLGAVSLAMTHMSLDSLRPYVNQALSRRALERSGG